MLNTSRIHFWQLAARGSFHTIRLEVCILMCIVQATWDYAAVREAGGACRPLLVSGSVLLEQFCLPKCNLRRRTECGKQNFLWSDCSWSDGMMWKLLSHCRLSTQSTATAVTLSQVEQRLLSWDKMDGAGTRNYVLTDFMTQIYVHCSVPFQATPLYSLYKQKWWSFEKWSPAAHLGKAASLSRLHHLHRQLDGS